MKTHILGLAAIAAIALLPTTAMAQGLKQQLVGTWSLVSYDGIGSDGSKRPALGANPVGTLILEANGQYAMILVDTGRPKWRGTVRSQTTTEEFATAAKGIISQFGTWTVDEANKTLVRKVVGALNPNIAGNEQKPTITLSGDEVKFTDANSGVTGGRAETVFRRVK
jgi:hypothetical protein